MTMNNVCNNCISNGNYLALARCETIDPGLEQAYILHLRLKIMVNVVRQILCNSYCPILT